MELKGPSFSNGRPSLPTSLLTCRIVSNSSDFAASSLLSCMHSCSYIKRRIRSSSHSRGRGNPEDEDAGGAGPEGEGGGGRLLGPIRENHDVLDLEGPSPPAFLVGEARDGMPMYCGWRVGNDGMGGGKGVQCCGRLNGDGPGRRRALNRQQRTRMALGPVYIRVCTVM